MFKWPATLTSYSLLCEPLAAVHQSSKRCFEFRINVVEGYLAMRSIVRLHLYMNDAQVLQLKAKCSSEFLELQLGTQCFS